jgi:hypothetical protein
MAVARVASLTYFKAKLSPFYLIKDMIWLPNCSELATLAAAGSQKNFGSS